MNKQQDSKQSISLRHRDCDSAKLHDFLSRHIPSDDISEDVQHDLRLVAEEIFSNIVNHADVSSEDNAITVELSHDSDAINIIFKDTGRAFNPVCDHENCIQDNDHAEGGMGIHLIKTLTDHQEYKRIGQQNVFIVTKHYNN